MLCRWWTRCAAPGTAVPHVLGAAVGRHRLHHPRDAHHRFRRHHHRLHGHRKRPVRVNGTE